MDIRDDPRELEALLVLALDHAIGMARAGHPLGLTALRLLARHDERARRALEEPTVCSAPPRGQPPTPAGLAHDFRPVAAWLGRSQDP